MKKIAKILVIIFSMIILLSNFQCTYAIEDVKNTGIKLSDGEQATTETGEDEKSVGEKLGLGDLNSYQASGTSSAQLQTKLSTLFSWIWGVGVVLSVIILIGIGIKYMLSSVEERAEYKKSMIPYIVGAAILFGGTYMPQLIFKIVKQIGW